MKGWIALSIVTIVLLVLACRDRDDGGKRHKDDDSKSSTNVPVKAHRTEPSLFLIGNDRGMIRPCGCAKPTLGGIDRRMALLKSIPLQRYFESAVLGFGNIIIEGGRQQELKVESFVLAMNEMRVKAYCVGDGDLQVGVDFYDQVRQTAEFPFVSANLLRDGARLFDSHAVVEVDGTPLVVTGYVSPQSPAVNEPGVEAAVDPDVAEIIAALTPGDASQRPWGLVLFGTGTEDELVAFAQRSGLSAAADRVLTVITGVSDIPLLTVRDEKRSFVELGLKGREVGEVPWPTADRMIRHVLDEAKGSHSRGKELLDFYRELVDIEDLLGRTPMEGIAPGQYAGSDECLRCHRDAHATWATSRHAGAWKTLVDSGDSRDPECVRCHVVGFGLQGGFDASGPGPVNVQCEACHGPSAAHAAQSSMPTPGGRLGPDFCRRCHDIENSPKFKYETYWPKIRHGK